MGRSFSRTSRSTEAQPVHPSADDPARRATLLPAASFRRPLQPFAPTTVPPFFSVQRQARRSDPHWARRQRLVFRVGTRTFGCKSHCARSACAEFVVYKTRERQPTHPCNLSVARC